MIRLKVPKGFGSGRKASEWLAPIKHMRRRTVKTGGLALFFPSERVIIGGILNPTQQSATIPRPISRLRYINEK